MAGSLLADTICSISFSRCLRAMSMVLTEVHADSCRDVARPALLPKHKCVGLSKRSTILDLVASTKNLLDAVAVEGDSL